MDRRPEVIWKFVQVKQDGRKPWHHHKMPVLLAGKAKEDADRLFENIGEEKEGSRATVPMQKDCNKIMLDLVKHQL